LLYRVLMHFFSVHCHLKFHDKLYVREKLTHLELN